MQVKAAATSQALSELIGKAYDAALDQRLWERFLESLVKTCKAHQALLLRREGKTWAHETLDTVNLDLNVVAEWDACKEHVDVWLQNVRRIPQGEPYSSTELVPNRILRKSGFHADILRPLEIGYSLGGIVENQTDRHSVFALYWRKETGVYEQQYRNLIRMLIPHVQQALRINRQLLHVYGENTALREALNRSPFGVVVLDAKGAPLFINEQADCVLSRNDGLTLRYGQLKCWNYPSQKLLDAALGIHAPATADPGTSAQKPFTIVRSTGQRPYQVLTTHLGRKSASTGFGNQAARLMFIHDPESRHIPTVEGLQGLYGLTGAEARLCIAMFGTGSLEQAAHLLDISRNTVKTQLARTFSKMNVSSQAELFQLLAAQCATPVR